MRRLIACAAAAAIGVAAPAAAQSLLDQCAAETCVARLTPDQMLGEVQVLINERRFAEAAPMLAALEQLPQFTFEVRYLGGQLAAGRGDHARAAAYYRAILADDPSQTRVRLELARTMMAMGELQNADRQFRLAQQDRDVPPEVARTIRAVRDVIRARRPWRFDMTLGIAPDTNINNATGSDTVDILWGPIVLPLTLDAQAKATSGTGQLATINGSVRVPVSERIAALADVESQGLNYPGAAYDDYQVQIAGGAEFRITDNLGFTLEAVGAQRWFGGDVASRQYGLKAGLQIGLSDRSRLGFQIDARRTNAFFNNAYDGWQTGLYATYEQAITRTIVVSAGVFARRDWLAADAYSSTEYGGILGIGGELPMGFNVGLSGSVSRARFDAPIPIFSIDPRADWRFTARGTIGNRKLELFGFSPQVGITWTRNASTLTYFDTDRLRLKFAIARYF